MDSGYIQVNGTSHKAFTRTAEFMPRAVREGLRTACGLPILRGTATLAAVAPVGVTPCPKCAASGVTP